MANTKFNAYTAVKLQCDFDYGLPRHLQRARSAKFPAQDCARLLSHSHFLTQTALWRYILYKEYVRRIISSAE